VEHKVQQEQKAHKEQLVAVGLKALKEQQALQEHQVQ
jgi:hypothetical protein